MFLQRAERMVLIYPLLLLPFLEAGLTFSDSAHALQYISQQHAADIFGVLIAPMS